jgi:hypothetical protein
VAAAEVDWFLEDLMRGMIAIVVVVVGSWEGFEEGKEALMFFELQLVVVIKKDEK